MLIFLYRIFSVDEYYWNDRLRYYRELDAVRQKGGDLTSWLEYASEGLRQTLESARDRILRIGADSGAKRISLQPKQEELLRLLQDGRSMAPREIWAALGITKQGAARIIKPLLEAGMIQRIGGKKTGRYIIGQ